ncbi:MAG: hypothetical protein LBQ44_04250 [Treponema sp.]|jgi:hypothetical protein|nr:hypothetical protein [Treponema sp.]
MEAITAIDILSLAVSAASLIVMVVGLRLGKKALFKSETLYGEEALDRFRKIERSLQNERLEGSYRFAGRNTTIIPRLEIERLRYNRQTMPPERKGYSQTLRFVSKDDSTGETWEKVWLLK